MAAPSSPPDGQPRELLLDDAALVLREGRVVAVGCSRILFDAAPL